MSFARNSGTEIRVRFDRRQRRAVLISSSAARNSRFSDRGNVYARDAGGMVQDHHLDIARMFAYNAFCAASATHFRMSIRHTILVWSEQGVITDAPTALRAGGVLPTANEWRAFVDGLLLWSGAVALGAALVFFIAHNWNDLGKFAKFALAEVLLVGAVLGYWLLGTDRAAGKASLLVACIVLGALLALFGQTYQTGADTWELFATWAALMSPWVFVGRFAGLWMLLIAVVNTAIVLYFRLFPGLLGVALGPEQQLWTLFAFNTAALIIWELAARRLAWLDERWAPRLLAIASGTTVTVLMLHAIFAWREASGLALPIYLAWLVCTYIAYRIALRDLMVLAGTCLSLIVVVTSFLAKHLVERSGEAGAFLFIALIVIAMAGTAAWWLKQLVQEARA
jgi:uncharacterized membrane protein